MGRPKRESNSVTKSFADRLSDLVDEKKSTGLSHNEICEQAGVGSGAMSDWLSDNKTANIDSLYKLAKYFGVSADYLLGLSKISSTDITVRDICQYTGLSQSAIESLHAIQGQSKQLEAISGIISHNLFFTVINYMLELQDVKTSTELQRFGFSGQGVEKTKDGGRILRGFEHEIFLEYIIETHVKSIVSDITAVMFNEKWNK